MRRSLLLLALAALVLAPGPKLLGQLTAPLDPATLSQFRWRPIGPANMSGRISDVEGIPSPSKTFYVAAAAGGIWKTTNNGTTFRPLFTNERVVSMGDIAIAPSDTLQIWAGTGEESARNSISPGGGIYKSSDGGLSWELKGLVETEIIGRIVVHPTNPNRVWVAAVGKTWASNPERGLYRTDDGGDSWQLVKFISENAGFVEVAIHPRDPDVLFAASWERVRGPYFLQSGGPGSALWRTTDGGDTWTKVEGGGWPLGNLGRIGLSISLSHPDIVYALVEAENAPDGSRQSGLYRSDDGGRTWDYRNGNNVRPFYYSQVRVHPADPDRVYWSSTPVNVSNDGGRTVGTATNGLHVDHHAMWIDPVDPERMIVGNDGGLGVTFDQGGNYIFPNTMPLGQFYEVSFGMEIPYTVCGGLQDNGSWCGPSRRRQGGITNYMWRTVGGGDGFFTLQDPERPEIVYQESQGGNMARVNTLTGERMSLPRPGRRRAGGGPQAGAPDEPQETWLFNWNTPMVLSPHDRTVLYAAGNRVLKYTNMGEEYEVISGDLTYADPEKIRISTQTTGGITRDATGAETYGTIVALAESPLQKGFLLAGTDDGRSWISRNDGGEWEELTDRFPGVPAGTYVRRMEPSSHDVNTFFVAFDGHRSGDFTPYVFVTRDGGRSFRSIAANLPTGGPDFVHVIRQDLRNPNLLFVGTDVGAYVSTDMGRHWQLFMEGLPTVPVHDLKIHPRDRELIAGTHGRSIWIVDIAPLQEMTDQAMAAEAHLFEPRPGLLFGHPPIGGESTGQLFFQVPSPSYGAEIVYRIAGSGGMERRAPGGPGASAPQAEITILDAGGEVVHRANAPATPGIHRHSWNFRRQAPAVEPPPKTEEQIRDSIQAVGRVRELVDSIVAAGGDREMLERTRDMLLAGNLQGMAAAFGVAAQAGAGGRAAADPLAFVERPAENWTVAQRGGGAAAFTPEMQVIMQAAQAITGGGGLGRLAGAGGGMGGAGQGPLAEGGEYTVILKVGERELRQPLRVIRGHDAGEG
jgi:photosystem II stability/assembly factor-like uncharacterized protein